MPAPSDPLYRISTQDTIRPLAVHRLKWVEGFLQVMGVGATIIQHGLHDLTQTGQWELGIAVFLTMVGLTVILGLRYRWSLAKPSFFRRHRALVLISVGWAIGTIGFIIFGPLMPEPDGRIHDPRPRALLFWSEFCLVLRAVASSIRLTRRSTARLGTNPALLLAGSFLVLITAGTILLMLPRAYASPETLQEPLADRFRIALFTSTSASCVTGLIVVDTGGPNAYWSPLGQGIIMGLFQLGGLGIMTCGALFAVVSGRAMRMRESATLREVLEAALLTTVILKKLGVPKIICRAQTTFHAEIFKQIGAHEVIQPEMQAGERLGHSLANPQREDLIALGEGFTLIELYAPKEFCGKSLQVLELRSRYDVNLIAIKRPHEEKDREGKLITKYEVIGVPRASDVIQARDVLVVVGSNEALARLPKE